jgi:hypothetical protein
MPSASVAALEFEAATDGVRVSTTVFSAHPINDTATAAAARIARKRCDNA